MKVTDGRGALRPIEKCYIRIPNLIGEDFPDGKIIVDNLPDVSDTKSANYNEDGIIGRSSPLHTYSYSGTRQISINFHFFITKPGDGRKNLKCLRAISSCAYPRDGGSGDKITVGVANQGAAPFVPPPICQFRCGNLLAEEEELCLILQNYSTSFPTEVAWDEETFCPYRFDVNTAWWVVYASEDLPSQSRIISSGR